MRRRPRVGDTREGSMNPRYGRTLPGFAPRRGNTVKLRTRPTLRAGLGLALVFAATGVFGGGSALAVSGAVSTTDNPGFADPLGTQPYTDQACLNGKGINCNIYLDKRDVWLSGLPISASLGS